MGFSEQMRESLGAEGARVEVQTDDAAVNPGGQVAATVRIHGGTRPATVDALRVRLIQAQRHWTSQEGARVEEADAARLEDRSHLMPAWTQATLLETRVDVATEVEPGQTHEVPLDLALPEDAPTTSTSCVITLNAQADIKGQIDPTGNGRVSVR